MSFRQHSKRSIHGVRLMRQVVIENPILNSPFEEPHRHFRFTDEGITDQILEGRRPSINFIPVPPPKKKGKQLTFDTQWTLDRVEENDFINRVRVRVSMWRQGGYVGVTNTTRRLLEHWKNPERERRLFFCQIEALETAIYLTEVAHKYGDNWIENYLRSKAEEFNPGLFRVAFKMATGTGKTVVMAMLIAWQTLNKVVNPQDRRFSNHFLVVTPGITIRDRLQVLLPSHSENYYRQMDLVPVELRGDLLRAQVFITNYHTFKLRELWEASKLTKTILGNGGKSGLTETPEQMVARVCREFVGKKEIIVINDEAHHCWRPRPGPEEHGQFTGDERKEAEQNEEVARLWVAGLEAIQKKIGIKVVYDLSATPFFLKGSGYKEGTLFPWVVSDFSLIDAIESGLVKIPRVPVDDNSGATEIPTYRHLWIHIRDQLPKKGKKATDPASDPELPKELEAALYSLYSNYEKYYRQWEQNQEARERGLTPPVMIIVCNNTAVSNLVYRYVAGYEKQLPDGTKVLVPGRLPIFSNVEDGRWLPRPNTLLIDSAQLESGEGLSDEFKKAAAQEIDRFREEYKNRFPGRDVNQITDEEILREVMNTVGKPGKLGEQIKCVVSVSMLTEGWDTNSVTHILGVRAFGTQLLSEQVVGRALRRMNYVLNDEGKFEPEYAEVYGVPFSFIPCSGSNPNPILPPKFTRVRALEDRSACEIRFPRLIGYRWELPGDRITAEFTEDSVLVLSTEDIPTKVQLDPIVGESSIHTLDDLKKHRLQEIAYYLSRRVLEKYFRDDEGEMKPWLFPQVLAITKRWIAECLTCKDNTFPQMLILADLSHAAADRIYRAITAAPEGQRRIMPRLHPYEPEGSTCAVDFNTAKPTQLTSPYKCHVSHVVADSGWEFKMADVLEEMPEVVRYVKNQGLGFTIPYTLDGEDRRYVPDFIACIDDGHGRDDPLHLIIEVTGAKKRDKEVKVSTARQLWAPAVNNHGGFGRWAFIEIRDPWNAMNEIRAAIRGLVAWFGGERVDAAAQA